MSGAPIVVGGEALYDIVAGPGLDRHAAITGHPGGGPFNVARTIGRLRQPVAFLGRLSTDRLGATHERMLVEDGVGLDCVVRSDDPTTLALASVDDDGVAAYAFYTQSTAAAGLTAQAAVAALPEDVAALHVGTLGLVLEPTASAMEAVVEQLAGRAMVVVDPNCRPQALADPAPYRERLARVLAHSDLVKVSEEDVGWLDPQRSPVEAARALLEAGPRAVLLTRGGDGALVLSADAETAVPAVPAVMVDTIGAGDAFGGGLVAWWRMQGLGRDALGDLDAVLEATRFASRVAALTCARAGASPPTLPEVRDSAAAARDAGTR